MEGMELSMQIPRQRDALLRYDFSKFLGAITRSSLIYDAIAIWTEMDEDGKLESFAPNASPKYQVIGPS